MEIETIYKHYKFPIDENIYKKNKKKLKKISNNSTKKIKELINNIDKLLDKFDYSTEIMTEDEFNKLLYAISMKKIINIIILLKNNRKNVLLSKTNVVL